MVALGAAFGATLGWLWGLFRTALGPLLGPLCGRFEAPFGPVFPSKWLQEIKDNSQGTEKRGLSFWGSKVWIFCSNFVKIVISGRCRESGENSL